MFLSAGVLSDVEREAALDSVPEMRALQLNWSIARNLARDGLLETLDAVAAGYTREAIAAHLDGAFLLLRVAGQLAESKAAELFAGRQQPTPWLTVPEGLSDESAQGTGLRLSLLQMPLEAAAMFLDAALHHLANAVVRMAWEAGFPAPDFKRLRFDAAARVTAETKWTQWRLITNELAKLETEANPLARFTPAQALLACARDPDVEATIEYRHRLVHRGVPTDLWTVAVERATGYATGGPISIALPITGATDPPQIEASRQAIGRALAPVRAIQDAIHAFLPKWAAHVGLQLDIEGADVHFKAEPTPSRVALPSHAIVLPGGRMRIIGQQAGHVDLLSREQRDPSQFVS